MLTAAHLQRHPVLIPVVALIALTLAALLSFANKAFHIDDPIFLWPAKQIAAGDEKPLAAKANWYGYTSTLAEVTNHCTFVSRFMLPVVRVAGWSELALHVQFALVAALAMVGVYLLAKMLCDQPFLASLLLLFSPAFFVSATTVMSDVVMLCLWVWSAVIWLWGAQSDRPIAFLGSGLILSMAVLAKYPAGQLVPLLAVCATSRRHWIWQTIALLMPVATLVLLELVTRNIYGRGLLSVAFAYVQRDESRLMALPRQLITGLCFIGGSFPAIASVWMLAWSRKQAAAGAILAVVVAVLLFSLPQHLLPILDSAKPQESLIVWHAIVFATLGAVLLWMAGQALYLHRDRQTLMLTLWVFGVFLFASAVNWTNNARSILPMGPAMAILALREKRGQEGLKTVPDPISGAALQEPRSPIPLDYRPPEGLYARLRIALSAARIDWRIVAPIACSAVLSILLAIADTQIANASRRAAEIVHTRARTFHGTIWFTGHWGWQWYMEQRGAKAVDYDHSLLPAGDLLVIPTNNVNALPMPPSAIKQIDRIDLDVFGLTSPINTDYGAMFYASSGGPLPWVIAPAPRQSFIVYRITQNILPPEKASE